MSLADSGRQAVSGIAVTVVLLLWFQAACGADLYARKMEIVKTAEGQVTVLRDSVSISDGETTITAGSATLNESRGVAVIRDSVFIRNPDALVWADSAVYLLDERLTNLYGDVLVEQDSMEIRAPMLVYSIEEKRVVAASGVEIEHPGRRFRVRGDRGLYDLAGDLGVVDSNPVLVLGRDEDTVTVNSTVASWNGPGSRALMSGDVRARAGRADLTCDTLLYFVGPDSGVAWGRPEISDSASSTKGDTIGLLVRDGVLERLTVTGKATGSYVTDDGGRVLVSGRTIGIRFVGGEVDIIEVGRMSSGMLVRGVSRTTEDG